MNHHTAIHVFILLTAQPWKVSISSLKATMPMKQAVFCMEGNIDTCNVSSCMYSSTIVFDSIGYHDPSTSLISSESVCISPCNTSTNPVCLVPQNLSIYPGQTPELTFATFGQRNGIVPTLIYIYLNTTYDILGTIRTLKECSSYSIPYEF